MPSPNPFSNSLKYKLWVRRLSVSAPKMTIKTQMSLSFRLLFLALVLGLGGAVSMWTYDLGRSITGFNPRETSDQLAIFQEQIEKLRAERDEFSGTVNAAESKLNIERSAQKQLVMQVKTLESENIKLKEDLAFFESLLPADTGAQGISIRRLKVDTIAPNQLRYRLLIMQGGKGEQYFVGNLQLAITVLQNGADAMITFPEGKLGDADKFKLGFKHYQRVEGVLTLPEGASMKAVQARVLERGQIRAQQAANL
jgi:hypothetical protein